MKNLIYAVIIAVCILVAGVVFMKTRSGGSGGIDSVDENAMVWMKCRGCNQSYEMPQKQYYEEVSEAMKTTSTAMMFTPPLTCQKCGQKKAFLAEKCPNCGEIFFTGSIPNDFPDRCPKCKHSKTEDSRKARLSQQ
jgi:predicted Zn-ribbon and HTH transcriptional regulator